MTLITNLDSVPEPAIKSDRRIAHASIASFQRPDNINGYSPGNVVSTTGAAALEFPGVARRKGSGGIITHATMAYNEQEGGIPQFELFLFDVEPTNLADQANFNLADADMEGFLGRVKFDLDAGQNWIGFTAYHSKVDSVIPFSYKCGAGVTSIYGHLMSIQSWTPASETKFVIRLGLEMD